MATADLIVGVVIERRVVADNPWVDHAWAPVAVLPDAPGVAPWTSLGKDEQEGAPYAERFYLGAAPLTLHSVDTAHFRDNLVSGRPSLWVSIRPTGIEPEVELVGVTADPYEGEGLTDTIGDIVEMLPMPADVAAKIAAFFDVHHVERQFHKRQREVSDPRKGGKRPVPGVGVKPERS